MLNNPIPLNIYDFGAKGDGVTDDAPAFQAALNVMITAGGGTLFVPPSRPNGSPALYAWKSAVSADFTPGGVGARASWTMKGCGSKILVQGLNLQALSIYNARLFSIVEIAFFGSVDTAHPNTIPAAINNVIYAGSSNLVIDKCDFKGIEIFDAGGGALAGTNAVIYASDCDIVMKSCITGSIGGSGRGMFVFDLWSTITVEDCTFVDFYFINNTQMAFGSYGFSTFYIWRPQTSNVPGLESLYGEAKVTFRRCRFDEGQGYYMVYISSDTAQFKTHWVEFNGCKWNVNPNNASQAISLYKVNHAVIRDCWMREGNVGSVVVWGRFVDSVLIERYSTPLLESPITAVDFDNTVGVVKVVDCVDGSTPTISLSGSTALQNIIERFGGSSLPAYTTIGLPAAASTPTSTVVYDSTRGVPVYNNGSSWVSLSAYSKGADTACANDLQLPSNDTLFKITGNTTLNAIKTNTLTIGKPFTLWFTGTPIISHNTAGGAGTLPLLLNGSMNIQPLAANFMLTLEYDGTNIQELSRKAP